MSVAEHGCPYVGLVPFTADDWPYFFGRDADRQIITANLQAARLTLFYGPSGVGKSSVLRAGVEHHLRQQSARDLAELGRPEFIVVPFSNWTDDPLPGLGRAIQQAVAEVLPGQAEAVDWNGRSLADLLGRWTERTGADLLVILDQFEEYFSYHGGDDGEGTLAVELPRAVNRQDLRANFLISIREDALARLDRFKGRIPNLFDNYLRIDHLNRAAAREAIVQPLARYNQRLAESGIPPDSAQAEPQPAAPGAVEIEPDLVEAVLDDVRMGRTSIGRSGRGGLDAADSAPPDEQRIEAPFLQLVMTRLWEEERRLGSNRLRLETYRVLNGAQTIVRTHLDRAMSRLAPGARSLAAQVFDRLVTPSGSKFAISAEDLAQQAKVPAAAVAGILDKLSAADTRILRPVAPPTDGPQTPRYEIFHDVLAPAVLDWTARQVQRDESRRRRKRWVSWASVVLLILLAVGIPLLIVWNRDQNQSTQAWIDTVLSAPPEAVMYTLEGLRPFQSRALPRLKKKFDEVRPGSREQLHTVLALAEFGDIRLPLLLEGIAAGPSGECPNIVRAMQPVRDEALTEIRQRVKQADAPLERQVRFATAALHLGDLETAADLARLAEIPDKRTAFIHNYAAWPGDLIELASLLRENKAAPDLADLRSAVCAAVGRLPWETLRDEQQQPLLTAMRELYQQAPDGGTHTAAYYALKQWRMKPPAIEPIPPAPSRGWYVNKLGMTMIKIRPGTFHMGSTKGEPHERPVRPVKLTQESFLAGCEVTVAQFKLFVAASQDPGYPEEERPEKERPEEEEWKGVDGQIAFDEECPVYNVSRSDAIKFCNWLSREDGRDPCYLPVYVEVDGKRWVGDWQCNFDADGYRLPTEAEWEYACRAKSQTAYSFGDNERLLSEYAWFESSSIGRTYPAGSKLPNGWGLLDMHGNVYECCQDQYGEYSQSPEEDPRGPGGTYGVIRGGGWNGAAEDCRSAYRRVWPQVFRNNDVGFRVARRPSGQPLD